MKYSNCVFVLASDDMQWCREKFNSTDISFLGESMDSNKNSLKIITGGASPEEDLVLLASCNHTLIGYGTFGLWAGILAQGEVVVPQSLTLFKGTASEEASREFNWTMLAGH